MKWYEGLKAGFGVMAGGAALWVTNWGATKVADEAYDSGKKWLNKPPQESEREARLRFLEEELKRKSEIIEMQSDYTARALSAKDDAERRAEYYQKQLERRFK
jgi:hypothetical protein